MLSHLLILHRQLFSQLMLFFPFLEILLYILYLGRNIVLFITSMFDQPILLEPLNDIVCIGQPFCLLLEEVKLRFHLVELFQLKSNLSELTSFFLLGFHYFPFGSSSF